MSAELPSEPQHGKMILDRLLGVVSPQLAEELERVLGEFRQKVEAEANVRLKKALLDKDAELRSRAEDDERRVREETSQAVRAEVAGELNTQFEQRLAAQLDALSLKLGQEAADAQANWEGEKAGLAGESARWRLLAEFHRSINNANSQTDILKCFLNAAEQLSRGVAVYLSKSDGLARWGMMGEAVFPELISEETIDPEWYFSRVVVRSRAVAAVCASGVSDRDAFDEIVEALKRAIENFGLRVRFFGRGGLGDTEGGNRSPGDAGATG